MWSPEAGDGLYAAVRTDSDHHYTLSLCAESQNHNEKKFFNQPVTTHVKNKLIIKLKRVGDDTLREEQISLWTYALCEVGPGCFREEEGVPASGGFLYFLLDFYSNWTFRTALALFFEFGAAFFLNLFGNLFRFFFLGHCSSRVECFGYWY